MSGNTDSVKIIDNCQGIVKFITILSKVQLPRNYNYSKREKNGKI